VEERWQWTLLCCVCLSMAEAGVRLDARNHRLGRQLVLLGLPRHADTWRLPGLPLSRQQV